MKTIGIIGGGIAGLACAARLQHAGYQVSLFEKNPTLGGRMNVIESKGFRFDLGPTIVMMPHIYRSVFLDCGENPEDYIPMEQLSILYDLFFENTKYAFPSDLVAIHTLLESIEKDSARGFFQYLSEIYGRYLIARDEFITKSFANASDFYNLNTLHKGLQLKTFDSAENFINKYIKNETINKMLAFQTLYIGIAPNQGPSLYSMIPMIEMVYGVHFMKGSMRTMAEALIKLCEKLGVKLYPNTPVDEILIQNKKAIGVRTNHEHRLFDIILNTSDFPYAMEHLAKDTVNKGKYTNKK